MRRKALEYTVITVDDQRQSLKSEIRSMEQQHYARTRDIAKWALLGSADFEGLNDAVVAQRKEQWAREKASAEVDVATLEITLQNVQEALAAIPEE
jgi:hypothetical protein